MCDGDHVCLDASSATSCQALLFQRQTYSPKELIVIDDPVEPASDIIAGLPGIRYLQTVCTTHFGSKLNLGIQEAHGVDHTEIGR